MATFSDLHIVSSFTGRGDGMGMNIAGGATEVQARALEYGITPAEVAQTARGTASYFSVPIATAASALASRGVSNPNLGPKARNIDALRLGDEVGKVVMGTEKCAKYITTSVREMTQGDKPFTVHETQQLATKRPSGERMGWGFHHVVRTTPGWAMVDRITFTMTGHTEETPMLYKETLRESISEEYHANWMRYSRSRRKDQKDKDAGKQLSRSTRNPEKHDAYFAKKRKVSNQKDKCHFTCVDVLYPDSCVTGMSRVIYTK